MTQANWNEFYMPYYLNSGVKYLPINGTVGVTLTPEGLMNLENFNWFGDTQMILRPLSDITDEELTELCKIKDPLVFGAMNLHEKSNGFWSYELMYRGLHKPISKLFKLDELSPAQFHYLLSKGFDLFGGIEQGFAMDATKTER